MSARRDWKLTAVHRADAGPAQSAMEITCGSCGKTGHIINSGTLKVVPSAIVEKKFSDRGWIIGGSPKADRCPECAAKLGAAKRHSKSGQKKEKVVADIPPLEPDQPREMTREQRRIIFLKLEEHYLDEAAGYDRGWSDKRVAEDLGVPRAWVAEIRDQNFGPAKDNEDVRDLLAAQERLGQEVASFMADLGALTKRGSALANDLSAIAKAADAIRKAVS